MFMLASTADCSTRRSCAGVTREGNMSKGMALAPFANTGMPLTTNAKPRPAASRSRRSSTLRRPVRTLRASTTSAPCASSAANAYSGCPP
jgi:hypothetical protein